MFARTFYKVCRDVAKLADVLGHSSIETTRIYLISTGAEHASMLERLGLVAWDKLYNSFRMLFSPIWDKLYNSYSAGDRSYENGSRIEGQKAPVTHIGKRDGHKKLTNQNSKLIGLFCHALIRLCTCFPVGFMVKYGC